MTIYLIVQPDKVSRLTTHQGLGHSVNVRWNSSNPARELLFRVTCKSEFDDQTLVSILKSLPKNPNKNVPLILVVHLHRRRRGYVPHF